MASRFLVSPTSKALFSTSSTHHVEPIVPKLFNTLLHGSEEARRENEALQSHSTTVGSKSISELQSLFIFQILGLLHLFSSSAKADYVLISGSLLDAQSIPFTLNMYHNIRNSCELSERTIPSDSSWKGASSLLMGFVTCSSYESDERFRGAYFEKLNTQKDLNMSLKGSFEVVVGDLDSFGPSSSH